MPLLKSYTKLAYSFNSMNQNIITNHLNRSQVFIVVKRTTFFTEKNFLVTNINYRKQEDYYSVFITGHVAQRCYFLI